MYAVLLLAVSVAPGLAFLVVIMRMDRREPEPKALVARVLGLGAVSGIAAALVEAALDWIPLFHVGGLLGPAAEAFLLVAPVEELAKLAVVLLFVWGNPNFNEENDGVVYVGASAVGFAVLENIAYVIQNGIGTGILRAFTSVPLHVFTAVVVGLYVGRAHFSGSVAVRNRLVLTGFLFAWAAHGAYDTFALSRSALAALLLPLLAGIAAFGIMAMRKGRRLSLLRWGPGPVAPVAQAAHPAAVHHPGSHRWMSVVARILLGICAAFWVLFAIGITQRTTNDVGSAILGAALMSFLPLTLGILLEVSYHRHRRHAAAAAASTGGLAPS
jgi:RsiW-degrading membrane proteinase PrsW (M82 family)